MKKYTTILALSIFITATAPFVMAQSNSDVPAVNINDSGFHLVQCDGPDLTGTKATVPTFADGHTYVPCDARHLMAEVQYIINVMTIFGVLAAFIGFAYAGYLYITGVPGNISHAHDIFKKVAIGFILMLTAWFIVYQILQWLTGNASGYLGSG